MHGLPGPDTATVCAGYIKLRSGAALRWLLVQHITVQCAAVACCASSGHCAIQQEPDLTQPTGLGPEACSSRTFASTALLLDQVHRRFVACPLCFLL